MAVGLCEAIVQGVELALEVGVAVRARAERVAERGEDGVERGAMGGHLVGELLQGAARTGAAEARLAACGHTGALGERLAGPFDRRSGVGRGARGEAGEVRGDLRVVLGPEPRGDLLGEVPHLVLEAARVEVRVGHGARAYRRGARSPWPGRARAPWRRPVESPTVTDAPHPPSGGHDAFHAAVAERVRADRASGELPGAELDRIAVALRCRTGRSAASNLAAHLRALDDAADIDIAPPTESSRRAGRGVKVAVHRLVGWYVGHLGGQLRQLGVATARAVRATSGRIDELERRVEELERPESDR